MTVVRIDGLPSDAAASPAAEIRCVVLDRDGTLIRRIPYLHDPAGVELLPTVVEGLRVLRDAGCLLFLHSNQSGIGRGMFSLADAEACNAALMDLVGLGDTPFEKICIATEAPDDDPVYRKPSPRFGRELMTEYALSPEEMCYIGDNISDLQAAERLGCVGVGVDTGQYNLRALLLESALVGEYPVFDTFLAAARYVTNGWRVAK